MTQDTEISTEPWWPFGPADRGECGWDTQTQHLEDIGTLPRQRLHHAMGIEPPRAQTRGLARTMVFAQEPDEQAGLPSAS